VELRERDLRFTPDETAALLRDAGLELASASLAALVARTEGWVAGLQLAGLSLHQPRRPGGDRRGRAGPAPPGGGRHDGAGAAA
jgi:LuxR family transcriptional regulator, maltose regulon positive regulatory protein